MSRPRLRSTARRLLIGILAVLAVLAAAHTGLWLFATGRLEDELAAWQAQNRALGWVVSAGAPARAGWPLAAAIEVPDLAIAGGEDDIPGGLTWRAARTELAVDLLAPRHLSVLVAGQQRLRLSVLAEFGFTADRFALTIPLNPGRAGPFGRSRGLGAACRRGERIVRHRHPRLAHRQPARRRQG